jgi:hypothetical protein
MAGEAVAEFLTLFDSKVGERGVRDNVVFGAKVVDALEMKDLINDGPCESYRVLGGVPGRGERSGW